MGMSPTPTGGPRPRVILVPVRIVLVTFLLTLLAFAVSLLLGILGTVMVAALRGAHPNLTRAYRDVALPVAGVIGTAVLVSSAALEIRGYRRAKALLEIERAS
jgi:hypothetical protein